MADKEINVQMGYSLPVVIFIVFLILKLTDNIDWSWLWVFSPIWIPFSVFFAFFLAVFILSAIDHVTRR